MVSLADFMFFIDETFDFINYALHLNAQGNYFIIISAFF